MAGGFDSYLWARVVFCACESVAGLLWAGFVSVVSGWIGAENVFGLIVAGASLIILELVVPVWVRENVLPWGALGLMGAIVWSARREKFAICVRVFLLIFALHSVLWWRGRFGSCGLMRILACVGPITAIVCLRGWNFIAERITLGRRILGAAAIGAMGAAAMGYYVVEPSHLRIFPLQRACEFVTRVGLLGNAPAVVLGDPMAEVCLHLPANVGNLVANDCDRRGSVSICSGAAWVGGDLG